MVFVWASGRKDRDLAGEWDRVRLGVLEERQGWGVGPIANKVWVQPESLAKIRKNTQTIDLNRIFRQPIFGIFKIRIFWINRNTHQETVEPLEQLVISRQYKATNA